MMFLLAQSSKPSLECSDVVSTRAFSCVPKVLAPGALGSARVGVCGALSFWGGAGGEGLRRPCGFDLSFSKS